MKRKKSENKLKGSEDKYRRLIEIAQEGIWVIDKDSNTEFVNPSMAKMLGYTVSEMQGKHLFSFMDDQAIVKAKYNIERRASGIKEQHDFEFIKKDGKHIVTSMETSPILDDNGNYNGAIAGIIDITERRLAEFEKNERLKELNCLYSISKIMEIPDLSIEEIIYRVIRVVPSSWQNPEISVCRIILDGIEYKEPDFKKTNWVQYSDINVNGKKLGLIEISYLEKMPDAFEGPFLKEERLLIDAVAERIGHIIERKQTEVKLMETNARHAAMIENIGDVIGIIGADGITKYQSPNIEKWFGWKPEDLIGKTGWHRIHPEDIERVQIKFNKLLETKERQTIEYRFKCKDGIYKWIELTASNRIDEPTINGVLANYRDISDRKKKEELIRFGKTRFQELVNTINSGVVIYKVINDGKSGSDYIIEEFNEFALSHEGKLKEDIIGKSLKDIRPNIDDFGLIDIFRTVWKSGKAEFFPAQVYIDDNFTNYYENRVFKLPSGEIVAVYDDVTEKKNIELVLRKNKQIIDSTTDAVLTTDLSGIIRACNLACEKIYGYSPKELIGKNVSILYSKEELPKLNWMIENLLEGKEIAGVEVNLVRKDKRIIVLSLALSSIEDENGKTIELVGIARDITEKKEAEEKLIESEDKFRALYDNAPLSYQSLNEDGSFKDINPTWLSILGYERNEIIGKFYKDFLHPDWLPHFEDNFPKFIKRGYVNDVQYKIRHKAGHYLDISFEGCIGYHSDGSFKQTYCVFQDITEKKEAEEKLIESKDRFRRLIDNMPSGVAIYKAVDNANDFEFIELNKKAEEITNTSKKEIIGHTLLETFPNMKNGTFINNLKKISKDGISINLPPFFYKDNQRQGWRENNIYKLASGEIVAIFKDVTDIKEAEEQLKKQNIELREANQKAEESNNRFNLAMTATKDGLYDWDLLTNEIYYSPGWKSMLGYNDDELPNDLSVWEKLTEAKDAEKSWKMQQELINKQRERFEMEFKMKHKEGHFIDILSRAEVIFDEHGKAIRMVGTHVDISERKKMENLLRESEDQFRQMFNNHNASMLLIDPENGNIIEANLSSQNFYGYPDETLKQMTIQDLNSLPEEEVLQLRTQAKKENQNHFVFPHRIASGEIRTVEVHSSPIIVNKKQILFSIIHDITDRKLAEDKVLMYQEHLEDLVKERTNNLEDKNKELERFNDLFVDREFRIKELKDEIKELKA